MQFIVALPSDAPLCKHNTMTVYTPPVPAPSPPIQRIKILTLGDCNTGKTSIVYNYLYTSYHRFNNQYTPQLQSYIYNQQYNDTDGITLYNVPIRLCQSYCDMLIQPYIYDCSGNTIQYSAICHEFYHDINLLVYVYDVTNVNINNITTQLQQFFQFNQLCRFVLFIGNKSDQLDHNRSLSNDIDQYIQHKLCNLIPRKLVAPHIQHSCTHNNNTIYTVWNQLMVQYIDQQHSDINSISTSIPTVEQIKLNVESSIKHRLNESNTHSIEHMSVHDIKSRLQQFNVPYYDCIEKSDYIQRLTHVINGTYQQPAITKQLSADNQAISNNKNNNNVLNANESVINDIHIWATVQCNNQLYQMLNSIHNTNELYEWSDVNSIDKLYKRALLKLHPDKTDHSNQLLHTRHTEMFKQLTNRYELYKKSIHPQSQRNSVNDVAKQYKRNSNSNKRYS